MCLYSWNVSICRALLEEDGDDSPPLCPMSSQLHLYQVEVKDCCSGLVLLGTGASEDKRDKAVENKPPFCCSLRASRGNCLIPVLFV